MSKLLEQANSMPLQMGSNGQPTALVNRITVAGDEQLAVFAHLIEQAYPEAQLNTNQIAKGGNDRTGQVKNVAYAIIVRRGGLTGTAAVFSTGKATLSGFLTEFQWPVSEEVYEKALAEIKAEKDKSAQGAEHFASGPGPVEQPTKGRRGSKRASKAKA